MDNIDHFLLGKRAWPGRFFLESPFDLPALVDQEIRRPLQLRVTPKVLERPLSPCSLVRMDIVFGDSFIQQTGPRHPPRLFLRSLTLLIRFRVDSNSGSEAECGGNRKDAK